MAIEKVGIYRSYHGPVPKDSSGQPLPKNEWPNRRAHSWVVRWFGGNGERYSRSFKSRKEAERHAEEIQSEVRDGKADVPEAMTLKAFGDMYLKIRTGLTERSYAEHERALRFLRAQFGDSRVIHKITPLDARRFLGWYRHRKVKRKSVAPATANKLLRGCQRIFREAVDCQLIRSNPFAGIRQERVGQPVWHHVTPDEYRRLFGAATSLRWRGMIGLAYCCGLRLGEILNLTWPDIDFEAGMVRVISKKNRDDAMDWTPKDKDTRLVPVPKQVINLLADVQVSAKDGQVYVFVSERGPNAGKRMRRANSWRDFNVIRRRAGVAACSMHDLRRSYCTNLARAIPMHVVQELAGHSDIRTTRRYYVKVEPDLLDAARQAVEASLEPDVRPD